ncbi:arginine decarboxylase [Alteromonas sp. 1_MG-2023]|uniref:arginine decarboxylase n=1 Tax=Alteromonas sp. 1_MG-2023 TaxID=3062669 RepID=UPI0026E3C2F4|nr:arginine decarboxylase [Alteromonas sp. 1_MG-2023]MDO6566938.1 arginine decarboxylase [Alteromonas sp. 1_MG-2023]
MSNKHYQIEVFKDVILVTLRGDWDMNTNIQYLAFFADTLKSRRGKAFHVLVDMRTWKVPDSVSFAKMKAPIQLDRRNQLSETWLEDGETVADHIANKFFNEQNFTLQRTKDIESFMQQVDSMFGAKTKAHIFDWQAAHAVDKENLSDDKQF